MIKYYDGHLGDGLYEEEYEDYESDKEDDSSDEDDEWDENRRSWPCNDDLSVSRVTGSVRGRHLPDKFLISFCFR